MLRLFVVPSAVFLCAGLASAQTPTLSLVPIVDDVRRECVGGPNDGQSCTSAADCEVLPDCQRSCNGDPAQPCADSLDCVSGVVCEQHCFCNFVIAAEPGDVIETEVFASNWSAPGQRRLVAWQVQFELTQARDVVLPLGWDRAFPGIFCGSGGACPPEYPICDPWTLRCVGPDHDPEQGVFSDTSRSDYVFFGLAEVGPLFDLVSLDYRVGSALWDSNAAPIFTEPKYCASLILEVLPDTAGTVTIPIVSAPQSQLIEHFLNLAIEPMDTEGLTIEIGSGDEPVELVPAASQWGLLVMALLLLAGAKVYFSRRRCDAA